MTSFIEELEAERQIVLDNSTKEIPVPPTGKRVVRFKVPADTDKLTGYIAAYRAAGALTPEQQQQLVIDCHDEILRRLPNGELAQIDDGQPLRFDGSDERWGGDDKTTARDCVRKLYNLDNQPLVLAGITDALIDWLQGIDAAVMARVEGKSVGGVAFLETPPEST